jgi:hypothetical protein
LRGRRGGWNSYSHIGLVSCAGSCSPDKLARLEDVIRREYALLLRDGMAPDELRNNQAQIKSQLIFSLEGVLNQMHRAARNEIYYGRFVPVAELVDEVDSVDTETMDPRGRDRGCGGEGVVGIPIRRKKLISSARSSPHSSTVRPSSRQAASPQPMQDSSRT